MCCRLHTEGRRLRDIAVKQPELQVQTSLSFVAFYKTLHFFTA